MTEVGTPFLQAIEATHFSDELTCMTQAKTEWKYKKRKSFESRKQESLDIYHLYPKSVPIILEKAPNGKTPTAQKEKYLVPRNLSVTNFILMVKKNMILNHDASIYLLSKGKVLPPSWTMGEVFNEEKDEDGFLYLTYNSYLTFTYSRSHGRNL